jgi:hypothetical protein
MGDKGATKRFIASTPCLLEQGELHGCTRKPHRTVQIAAGGFERRATLPWGEFHFAMHFANFPWVNLCILQ